MLEKIEIKVPIQREDPAAPRYVIVPAKFVALWELERTTEVDIEVNGKPGGRRRLRRWDDARWYIQLPQRVCDELAVETGRVVNVSVRLAVQDLPGELVLVLGGYPEARERWDGLTAAEQHKIRADVDGAHLPKTRWERAATALGADAPVPDHIIRESHGRQPLRVEIHAPPDSPESRKALDEALDSAAALLAGMVLYESWKEVTIANGEDPSDRKLVPERLMDWWEGEFDRESRDQRKPGRKRREKL